MNVQLDLFKENDRISLLEREIDNISLKTDNVRRGLFARHTELSQIIVELQTMIVKQDDKIKELESKIK